MAVDQKDSVPAAGETLSVPVNEDLLVVGADAATNIVLMSGSDVANEADVEVIALAQAPTGAKVTFKNGAEETVVTADTTGKVALPTAPANITLTAEETASGLYAPSTLNFIGWTNADDTKLYTADITDITENTTLYAKFEASFTIGDVTGDSVVNATDRAMIIPYVTALGAQPIGNIGKLVNPKLTNVVGDVTGDNVVNATDRAMIIPYVTALGAQPIGNIGNKIYYINK